MIAEQQDVVACEAILRKGSKSFHAASRLLPLRVRIPTMGLYAFCRVADDHVDDLPEGDAAAKLRAVGRLETRLDAAYAGAPHDSPVDRLFASTVRAYSIPRQLPDALLDGMRWDAEGRTIVDESTLLAYAARVASAVGVMMTLLMGERRADVLARACDLGVAMQLTNIARDVGEDARNGRVYLPTTWLADAGIDRSAFLRAPTFDARVAQVIERLLARADELYVRSDAGLAELPRDCRRAILAARNIYAAIGDVVAKVGHDSVSQRAVVSSARKLWIVGASWWASPPASKDVLALPPLAETEFLIRHAAS